MNDSKIRKLFADIISHDIFDLNSKKYVKLKTSTEWNITTATEFQEIVLDRNPLGYGGPFDFKCEKIEDNLFIVTWNCYNIAD